MDVCDDAHRASHYISRMMRQYLAAQHRAVDMQVYLGRGYALMTEHLLDGAQVGSPLEQMGRKGVTQRVGRDVAAYAGSHRQVSDYVVYHEARQLPSAAVEKEDVPVGWRDAQHLPLGQIRPYLLYAAVRHRHYALLVTLALHHQVMLIGIYVAHLQIYQLADTQSAPVERLHNGAVTLRFRQLRVYGGYHGIYLLHAQHFGQI